MPFRRLPAALLALLAAALPSAAQAPAGPEFQVNTTVANDQHQPAVATSRDGGFVVVWTSPDGDGDGVFGRRFDEEGRPRGVEFRANTLTLGQQEAASVALGERAFVVVWTSAGQDGSGYGVFGQQFDSSGGPKGAEFQVNAFTTGDQYATSVALGPDGAFVVVWQDAARDGSNAGTFARIFNRPGARPGDFAVTVEVLNNQTGGQAAMADDGRFVVAWNSYAQDGSNHGVFLRRFDSAGNPVGGDFQVNTVGLDDQYLYGLDMAPDGRFVVTWKSYGPDGDTFGVRARRFDAAHAAQGDEFSVNTFTTGEQRAPVVGLDAKGRFVAAWESPQDLDGTGIFGQWLDSAGAPRGLEFQVNSYTTFAQSAPSMGVDEVGNFVVAWQSPHDGSGYGVFAQRFGGVLMTALDADLFATLRPDASDGNGVLEPGESAVIETTWTNGGGSTLTGLTASAPNFTGPAGGVYTVLDDTATFPSIPVGEKRSCMDANPPDCYEVSVTAATRPAVHWDARFEEENNTIILGQAKLWDLHLGDSFVDVPRTNLFYPFVETLLHRGVTAGCTGTEFCPGLVATRAQMAVFVLLAHEGAAYTPPPCTAPPFDDVPAGNPFCPWIQELAVRGVVGGCGGPNYCPAQAVTRAQMAVFVLRTQNPAFVPPACSAGAPAFTDVAAGSPFCPWIEELARRGIVSGCAPGRYCPGDPVTRQQMGVFLSLTFDLELYGP